MTTTFHQGDLIEVLSQQPAKSVQFIYFDPPFGTTKNWWDERLEWPRVFTECFRVLRDDGTLAIHCSVPFNYELIRSAPRPPAYSWYWVKKNVTGFLSVNKQPMRRVEEILVWNGKRTTYYPQRDGIEQRIQKSRSTATAYVDPVGPSYEKAVTGKSMTHLIDLPICRDGFSTRPRELVELMINSYTKEGDIVLDATCYKGLSGLVCRDLKRNWIGIDKHHRPDWI